MFSGLGGLILIGVIVYFVSGSATRRSINRSRRPAPRQPVAPLPTPTSPAALAPSPLAAPRRQPNDVIRELFARGDLTLDEFQKAQRALGYPVSRP